VPVPALLDQLRQRRDTAREAAETILTRASDEGRDLDTDELTEHRAHVVAEREAADEADRLRDEQLAELRAGVARNGRPVLSRASQDLARQFRSAIFAKNPQPIDVFTDLDDEWPSDLPEVQGRVGKVRVHTRDTLTTTATQALSTDVYGSIVQHLVETSSLMAAGATVVTTSTGESLVVPRSSGFVTSAIIGEGASITESDPTLSTVTLGAFKYSNFFQISQELANDSPTNLLSFLATQAALSLGLGAAGFGDDLVNGTGSGQPRGLLLDAGTGHTMPTGTGTSLGAQATAGQGTDILWSLVGSLAEPYAQAPSAAFLMRNASDIVARKLKDSTGQPVQGLTERGRMLGYPSFVDPFMPAMANAAESIAFGDFSRYFIRIVNGVRFERSDDFAFQNDLVSFRCIIRLDGALIDTGSIKTAVNTT
jgi:HK97 family phage major capsid protein